MLLSINSLNPQPLRIQQVVEVLKKDGVIIYPTDTVYGLGCSIFSKNAMKRMQQIKNQNVSIGTNPKKPLTFICANQTEVQKYTQGISTSVFKLLRRKLPGPYTFVFKAAKIVPKMMLTPRSTVGLRWPDHPITNEIVKSLGHPILSSSLRISADELYDDPHELHEKYKKQVDLVVDGGTIFAENSTIVDFSHGESEIIRIGKGPLDWLDEV